MKKLVFILPLVLFVFISCNKNEEHKLEATPKTLTFAAQTDDAQTVTVTAENVGWDVEKADAGDAWYHIEKKDGNIAVTVDENPDMEKREAKFNVKPDNDKVAAIEITVIQNAAEMAYSLVADIESLSFGARDTETQTITVTAENVEWYLDVPSELNWLDIEAEGDKVSVSANKNLRPNARTGEFLITSDITGVQPVTITVTQQANDDVDRPNSVLGGYMQDYYGVGESNFRLAFYNVDFDEWGYPAGDGYFVEFDFFSEFPESEARPNIAEGTYKVENTKKKFTAIPGEYIYDYEWEYGVYYYSTVTYYEDSNIAEQKGVSSGTFTVERSGSDYIIVVDVVLSDDTPLEFYYEGELPIANNFLSTLTDDLEVNDIIGARASYYGDLYGTGSHYWYLDLWGDGLDFDGRFSGTGNYFRIEFYSDTAGDGSRIPAGTYQFKESSKDPWTAVAGYVGLAYVGSWYLKLVNGFANGDTAAPLFSERLIVSHEGSGYKIEIDAKDDAGNRITSTFEGEINITSYIFSPAGEPQVPTYEFPRYPNGMKR